jgi:hypothetical protein
MPCNRHCLDEIVGTGFFPSEKEIIMTIIFIIIAIPVVLWLGLQVKPRALPPYSATTPQLETVALPAGLPAPVERYYRGSIGDQIPVIETAVLTGSVKLRFNGITFNSRFRFVHDAGKDYRHYIDTTIFGYPLLRVNEHYLDGNSRLELPFGVVENEPKINMAANLGLWAESIWLPSIFITDPRVHWQAIDDNSARLIVPFEDGEDEFIVTFDPQTGLLHEMQAMRYKDAKDEHKVSWHNVALEWKTFHDMLIPYVGSVAWLDEGSPWATFTIEDVVYNVDVSEYVRAFGP